MTHLTPGGATRSAAALRSGGHSASLASLGIDDGRLREIIAAKRTQIALIEMEWVAACERSAARNAGRAVRVEHRETWDRAMWHRYLAAAADTQASYLPRLRRLYDEVARLEQLQTSLSAAAGKGA